MTSRRDSIDLEELGACPIAVIAQIIKNPISVTKKTRPKAAVEQEATLF